MELEIILLIWVWQRMNKTICQNILQSLKVRQDHKALSQKELKEDVLNSAMTLLNGRKVVFKAFESGIFLKSEELKQSEQSSDSDISLFTPKEETGLKILTPQQILERLPIALAQVKAGNNSESLLNEIRQIVY